MIKNYFKTAWRNLVRNKVFSFINIIGLGLGIAASLFIYLWVQDEKSKDNFHENSERLYQVIVSDKDKSGALTNSYDNTPGLLADALKEQVPEITGAATVIWENDFLFTVGEKIGKEKGRYVGTDFFSLFSFPLLEGNKATALSSPDNIVISRKIADKYFGKQDPIGKTIRINDNRDYLVSGIVANVPGNSTLTFDFVMPIQHGFEESHWMIDGWNHFGPFTYGTLRNDASLASVNAKLKDFLYKQDKVLNDKVISLQLFRERYLYSRFTNGVADGGRIEYVRLFSIIAVFILLIACINFMNLATARSVKRSREVGVRKVAGAMKGTLFRQFVFEAIITTFLSVLIAIALVVLLLPFFNRLTEKNVSLHIGDPSLIISLFLLTLITGFIAGSYPALFLSSLKPISVLKGSLKFKNADKIFRKGLVVFQFTLSIVLIVCTIVVYKQMNYVQKKNLGLDRSRLIYMPVEGDLVKNYENFKLESMSSGHIENISFCGTEPTNVGWWSPGMQWEGKDPEDKTLFAQVEVSYDFLKTMKIDLVEGRDFSPLLPTDSTNFIINEAAAKYMKMQHPVGASFSHGNMKGKIIGLVKDYHFRSLHNAIAPAFINLAPGPENGIAIIRTWPDKIKQTLATIEAVSKKYNSKYPFSYSFVDDDLKRQYHSEMIIGQLSGVFAFIAIFISCMGLFGLSMFMAEQRRKEIGIRKVIGASVSGIVGLLSQNFLVLVVIAFLIASPVAWWAMNKWLQDFAYRTDIGWTVFAITALIALCIAMLTISFQAVKAAIANPVKSLRTE
ncbi:ABC transporter permease [Terrimonas alba]|uniref:ABC transporter permease n=1 Tax=Terrimonas alba TaxID=3349636 RepID=UPI0035F3664E